MANVTFRPADTIGKINNYADNRLRFGALNPLKNTVTKYAALPGLGGFLTSLFILTNVSILELSFAPVLVGLAAMGIKGIKSVKRLDEAALYCAKTITDCTDEIQKVTKELAAAQLANGSEPSGSAIEIIELSVTRPGVIREPQILSAGPRLTAKSEAELSKERATALKELALELTRLKQTDPVAFTRMEAEILSRLSPSEQKSFIDLGKAAGYIEVSSSEVTDPAKANKVCFEKLLQKFEVLAIKILNSPSPTIDNLTPESLETLRELKAYILAHPKEVTEIALELHEQKRTIPELFALVSSYLEDEIPAAMLPIAKEMGGIANPAPKNYGEGAVPDEELLKRGYLDNDKRYRIVKLLGSGGMGVVFRGFDTQTGKEVAIKVLDNAKAYGTLIDRFKQEWQILTAINHPNIVRVYGGGEAAGRLYFVMELVEDKNGKSSDLTRFIHELHRKKNEDGSKQPLELAKIMPILIGISKALKEIGARGIVHRDLKPANIFIKNGNNPMLGDFGVAMATKPGDLTMHTESGMAVGTISYFPPEAFMPGKKVDKRSDQFSFAVLCYILFTNIHPFKKPYVPPTPPEGMSDDEKERYRAAARQRAELAIMRETLNTIETLTQDKAAMAKKLEKVPFASMRPILLKMLSFDPEDRYQDYDQLIADFENAAKEEEKL